MAVDGGEASLKSGGKQRSARGATTISIVGAGRLGTALARALASGGYRIEAVVARTMRHARRAAEAIGTHPLSLTSTQLDRLPSSDILFITTPDDVIAATAERLAATIANRGSEAQGDEKVVRKSLRARTALHASGALSSGALSSLCDAGFATGSMHPLVSVSDSIQGAHSLRSAFFCVEGGARAVRVARRLVRSLGAQSFSIGANDKALYHAAAVMASGHVTALFDIAMEMLGRCGLTRKRARTVLLPLLLSALENLRASDTSVALTGTFARADTATVKRHLDALGSQKMKDALAVYAILGERSLQLAKAAGARAEALKEIESMLMKATQDRGGQPR